MIRQIASVATTKFPNVQLWMTEFKYLLNLVALFFVVVVFVVACIILCLHLVVLIYLISV